MHDSGQKRHGIIRIGACDVSRFFLFEIAKGRVVSNLFERAAIGLKVPAGFPHS
jgi:hypothetical protein